MIFKINYNTLLLLYYYFISIQYYTLTQYPPFYTTDAMQAYLTVTIATVDPKPWATHTWLHIKYAFSLGLSAALIMETAIR
jgi:hypothetical protein